MLGDSILAVLCIMDNPLNEANGKRRGSGFVAYLVELARVVSLALAVVILVRVFLIQPFVVRGASMEPNFYDREYLVIDELTYRFREPMRGDVVVFRYPRDPRQFFIKRIIGLPGETVVIGNGRVKISDVAHPGGIILDESAYLSAGTNTAGERRVVLGQNEYYLLGDNRSQSLDSRIFGPVTRSHITGRAFFRGWPISRAGTFLEPGYAIP